MICAAMRYDKNEQNHGKHQKNTILIHLFDAHSFMSNPTDYLCVMFRLCALLIIWHAQFCIDSLWNMCAHFSLLMRIQFLQPRKMNEYKILALINLIRKVFVAILFIFYRYLINSQTWPMFLFSEAIFLLEKRVCFCICICNQFFRWMVNFDECKLIEWSKIRKCWRFVNISAHRS